MQGVARLYVVPAIHVMDQQTFSNLLERYLSEDLSREEAALLLDSLQDDAMREQWQAALDNLLANKSLHGLSDPARMQAIRQRIVKPKKYSLLKKMAPYATAAAVLTAVFTYAYRSTGPKSVQAARTTPLHNVTPGGNKAVLTLADGSQIALDSAGMGDIASQGSVRVIKLDSGQLAYRAPGSNGERPPEFNTLATPRGGQFRVVLPDGSKVWLNAASSLRFPTAFTGNDRLVQLSGEAYFEVAKNARQPFKVMVDDLAVQVLGTSFNVKAYKEDGKINTTLLEGAVNVQHGTQVILLKPGQQATMNDINTLSLKENVNMEEVVAWKNGYFQFNHEPLKGVMGQLARWYDAEVTYEGKVPEREFGGQIARSSSITDVLKMLELSDVHFRVEGKKIIVTP